MVTRMSEWEKLQKSHPAIEPRPVSTIQKSALAGNLDMVNKPPHYRGKVECIDAIEASMTSEEFAGYLRGNIQKYIFRAYSKHPNPLIDLEKAQWYLSRLIDTEKKRL
jgi:hypothetical protein